MKKKLLIICLTICLGNMMIACDAGQGNVQATPQPTAEQTVIPTATPVTQVGGIVIAPSQKEEVREQATEPPIEVESKPKAEYYGSLNEHEIAEIEGIIDKIERLTDE